MLKKKSCKYLATMFCVSRLYIVRVRQLYFFNSISLAIRHGGTKLTNRGLRRQFYTHLSISGHLPHLSVWYHVWLNTHFYNPIPSAPYSFTQRDKIFNCVMFLNSLVCLNGFFITHVLKWLLKLIIPIFVSVRSVANWTHNLLFRSNEQEIILL